MDAIFSTNENSLILVTLHYSIKVIKIVYLKAILQPYCYSSFRDHGSTVGVIYRRLGE